MSAHVEFLGDGDKAFKLTPDLMEELERKTGIGMGALCRRVIANECTLAEQHEVIRLALIGGGTDPKEAAALIATYVRPRLPIENWNLAGSIMALAYYGDDGKESA
jgi:hypothetical protein